jgi:tRNA(Leu) C34 or U34 (ribose-2'-O)-methylase TrmL
MSKPANPLLLALYEPDIAQNAGAMMRTCACFGVDVAVIEPAGFRMADSRFRRAGMDYLSALRIASHNSWTQFDLWRLRPVADWCSSPRKARRICGISPSPRETSFLSVGNRPACLNRSHRQPMRACEFPSCRH